MSKQMPTFDALMNPLLDALFVLGGSGSIDELYEKVLELEKIGDAISSVPHNPEKSNQTEVGYRLAWARTYLKKYGFLENSSRGIWALTKLGKEQKHVAPQVVVKAVREADKAESQQKQKKQRTSRLRLTTLTHQKRKDGGRSYFSCSRPRYRLTLLSGLRNDCFESLALSKWKLQDAQAMAE